MAVENPFLTNWVRNACSMEMGLVGVLEEQIQDEGSDPTLRKGLDRHLSATRQHVELLKGCLQRMGDSAVTVEPSNPMERMYGHMDGDGVDPTFRTELLDFVTENFEAATYKAISALAQQVGDLETARVCQQILKDEISIARALDQRLLDAGIDSPETIERENARLVRAGIEALNAHNLPLFEQYQDERIWVEVPGALGPLDKREYSDYFRNFLTAFPNLHFEVGRVICEEDAVVANWVCTGNQRGRFRTPDGFQFPPTNRGMTLPGSGTLDIRNGRCVRAQLFWDNAALLAQLGIMPQP